MAKFEKDSKGFWHTRIDYYDENGTRHFKRFKAGSRAELAQAVASFTAENTAQQQINNTFDKALEDFIDNRRNVLSPSTVREYHTLRRNAYTRLREINLDEINVRLVQQTINDYAEEHSPKSVRNAFGLLTSFFKAVRPNLNLTSVLLPQKLITEVVIPSSEEVTRLLQACLDYDPNIYLPILLGAFMGLRRSEVFALTWDDINLKGGYININKALVKGNYGYVVKAPKSKAGYRRIDIPNIVMDYLKRHKKEPLFTYGTDSFQIRYAKLAKMIGITTSFHALRHYYASVMLLNNVPTKYAMQRMGHATPDMLNRVYQHVFEDEQQKFTEKLDDYFDSMNVPSGKK